MQKLAQKINRAILLQNIVLVLVAVLVTAVAVIYITPDKNAVSWMLMPYLYFLVFAVPFALVVMIYTILIFTSVAKSMPALKNKLAIASWASLFVGIWTLGYFAFAAEIHMWAFSISHDLVVAIQSSPVVLGFVLLALHTYVARVALKQISAATIAKGE